MVYYRLKEKDERYIRYEYFPEKHMERIPGIIVADTESETIDIERLAEDDFIRKHSVREQNELRDSVNEMRRERGEPELTEAEWPTAASELQYTFYGSHAVRSLVEKINTGVIPDEGMAAWY